MDLKRLGIIVAVLVGFVALAQNTFASTLTDNYAFAKVGAGVSTSAWSVNYFGQGMDFIKNNNIKLVRFPIEWHLLQWDLTNRNYFDWNTFDGFINKIPADAQILGILGPGIDISGGLACNWDNTRTCANPTNDLPGANDNAWKNYITQVINHYKNRIHAWEIINEPDHPFGGVYGRNDYTDSELQGRAQVYGDLVNETAKTIKATDANALVITGGLADYTAGAGAGDDLLARTKSFATSFLQRIDGNLIDGFGIHPYRGVQYDLANNSLKNYLTNLHALLVLDNFNVPIWITEFGFPNSGGEKATMQMALDQIDGSNVASAFWYRLAPREHNDTDPLSLPYALISFDSQNNLVTTSRTQVLTNFNFLKKGLDGISYINWLKNYNGSTSNGSIDGDFNLDLKVDNNDYLVFVKNFINK